ncbi:PWWP domain-containing protein 1, partial [Linum grandiflorum]
PSLHPTAHHEILPISNLQAQKTKKSTFPKNFSLSKQPPLWPLQVIWQRGAASFQIKSNPIISYALPRVVGLNFVYWVSEAQRYRAVEMSYVADGDGELDKNPVKIEDVVESGAAEEGKVSKSEERDDGASGSEDNTARVLAKDEEGGSDGERKVFDGEESKEMEEEGGGARVSEVKNEGSDDELSGEDDQTETENSSAGDNSNVKGEVYSSLLSEFEAYVANEKSGAMLGTSRALSYGFEVGDMVWGKVKSHPWWPGQIFNESLASSSVRRTRREGHVLVAFFGDSSYGWFDPAELIPFELHFGEKSQQTSSRTFAKAVEEAVDEASRRCGLALVCRCRSKCNFRPTNVSGYFEVDIPNYEPSSVYSVAQIRKARDGFQPRDTLAFIKRLARDPVADDPDSIDYIRYRATAAAIRTAVFEEFDETYGQAFGAPGSRGSDEAANASDHPVRTRTLAPLSGPLVIAEPLRGGNKSSKKAMKLKDHSKKDKYLFKRRDEPSESKTPPISRMEATPLSPAAYAEGSSVAAAGDFVLQKRAPAPPSSAECEMEEVITSPENKDASVKEPSAMSDHGSGTLDAGHSEFDNSAPSAQQVGEVTLDLKNDLKNEASVNGDASLQSSNRAAADQPRDLIEGKVKKKAKVLKRPLPEGSSAETVTVGDKKGKKKKKKEQLGTETGTDDGLQKDGKMIGKRKGKKSTLFKTAGLAEGEIKLPHLLRDLHSLALNPFHGAAQMTARPIAAVQFFLRFRSLVYQKSLANIPPTNPEGSSKSAASDENVKAVQVQPTPRPVKPSLRPDDPSKSGRKRVPSDRQEEIAVKKKQKLSQVKSLTAEKKAGMRSSSEPVNPPPRLDTNQPQPRARVVEPTMLVMKFPPQTSLPSPAELKARFARFGPLDQSATRVFWKSCTCRVVYRYKLDAEAAIRYATRKNSNLFGNLDVKYSLRDIMADDANVVDRVPPLPPPYQQPVKSILKKSNGDEPGGNGNGSRGANRVKFVLGGEEDNPNPNPNPAVKPPLMSINNASSSTATCSTTTTVGMDFNSKSFQNSNAPPLLPLPPQFAKLPMNPSSISSSSNSQPSSSSTVDVSGQMLSLLTKCSDVVAGVSGWLGYVPYHPL